VPDFRIYLSILFGASCFKGGNTMAMTNSVQKKDQFGIVTNALASVCHNCEICPYANRRPNSAFEKLMRWHRKWCPAWAAHTKIYGAKPLSQ
jgi:hypothetical protein